MAALTAAFVLVTVLPAVIAIRDAPPGSTFDGTLLNHFDQYYYQAAQRSAARRLPSANRFTAEPGAPGPIAPLYPLLGRFQRLTGLPTNLVYHLPRLLSALALPAVLVALFGLCFPGRPGQALWGAGLALFPAGALILASSLAVAGRSGERIHESNTAISFAVFPHFAVSYLGLSMVFLGLAMALRRRPVWQVAATAAAGGVLLDVGHTFLLLVYVLVLSGVMLTVLIGGILRNRRSPLLPGLVAAGAAIVPSAPLLAALHDEQSRLEQLQGFRFPSSVADSWWTWAIGYGIVSLLAVAGTAHLVRSRRRDPFTWLLLGWAAVQFGLIYLPTVVFQRRFSEGLVVPLAGLASVAVVLVADRLPSALARWLAGSLLAVLVGYGAVLIVGEVGVTGQYVGDDLAALLATVHRDDVVLAGQTISALLPARSDGAVVAARPVETLQYRAKRAGAVRWAADPASAESRAWLRRQRVTMVVVSAADGRFAPRLDDPAAACLRPVFAQTGLAAYRVVAAGDRCRAP